MRPPARAPLIATLGALVVLVPGTGAPAQQIGVRAYVSPGSTVGVGRQFVVNLEVTGTQSLDSDPAVPELGDFAQYLGSGTSTSMQIVNGRTSVSLTVQYRYQALTEGSFTVPAIEVRAGGGVHRTQPFELTVSSAPPSPSPDAGRPGVPSAAESVAPTDLFVTAEASRRRVRVGEPLLVEYRIWTRVDVSSYNFTRVAEPEGFWVEDATPAGSPSVEQVTRDGRQYATALIRRVALVPSGPGTKTIQPLGVEAQVRVRRLDDPFESLFGRSSLFGTTAAPVAVLSNPLTIEVEPLPAGAPRTFSGVVGSLDLSATVDRDSVAANEAVTLTVRVEGRGNVRAVRPPELDLPDDFEAFPPEVSESVSASGDGLRGSKTFEYVVIPRAPGRRSLPALSVAYFDADAGVYRSASTAPIPLVVTGSGVGGPAALARGGVAQLRQDIRFIHLGPPGLRRVGRSLHHGAGFWLVVLLPMAAVLGALALQRHRDRLSGDVAYARGRRARRRARTRLAQAQRLTAADDRRAFYAEMTGALRGYVADRLNLSEASLQVEELAGLLERAGVSPATAAEVVAVLDQCDRQRFAPPGEDAGERVRVLERGGRVMQALEKEIGR